MKKLLNFLVLVAVSAISIVVYDHFFVKGSNVSVEAKCAEKAIVSEEAPAEVVPVQQTAAESNFDKLMREYGLVDIQTLDPTILVDLKYATTDNFVGKNMYGSLKKAYLEENFAKRVVRAQDLLRRKYKQNDYRLLIYDAARPISVQRTMKRIVMGTKFENFVADGSKGGRHNYGVAVDITIVKNGVPLDMGTGFDSFEAAAAVKGTPDTDDPSTRTLEIYSNYINGLAARGEISKEAAENRIFLTETMLAVGLYPYRREWWHFELIDSMKDIREKYSLLDF